MLKTIKDININLENYDYNFQEDLTKDLDLLNWDFDQDLINQIVLWKVNRYAKIDNETLELLNKINKEDDNINETFLTDLLEKLLNTKWIKLPMASTILRFKNPNIFQIIDQRVYRFIYWEELKLSWIKNDKAIKLYLSYIKDLKDVCKKYKIDFSLSDRILYALDKKINKHIKIKY